MYVTLILLYTYIAFGIMRGFTGTLTEVFRYFSSVVRQMPGHKMMQRGGTACIPPPYRRGGLTKAPNSRKIKFAT
jgi:hypothetical protein